MKSAIYAISLLIAAISATPLSAASTIEEADSAYMRDDFARAAQLFEQAAREDGTSSYLYYNLGNCYYRQGALGRAIVAYERALRLDPSNDEARANLEFVNSKITDVPGQRGMFIQNAARRIATAIGANTWAAIALTSFILLLGAVVLYIFASDVPLRKAGFFGGGALLIVCIAANVFASIATDYSTSGNEAVVTVPASLLSTSPRAPKDRSEEAMLLHEGTKVEILDSLTTRSDSTATRWYDVRVDNDHRAWINAADVERI